MREDMKFRNAVNGFNKTDVMTCIESLLKEIAEQKNKIKELEAQLCDCRASLAQAKEETQNKDMCAQCDAAKVAQAQLGAAMMDAKRFSELILKEANDKSAQVLNTALGDVSDATDTANGLSESLKAAKENFAATLDSLQDELATIILSFMDFRTDLEKKGEKFNYTTDFAAMSAGESK
ncbi:MAG: DivIVA domain-containing protein [Clostridia bacterium]|nr:DivIVA domain-containing protein [Clostridia bacterium]